MLLFLLSDKNNPRPARKEYGRLSVDDDTKSATRLDLSDAYDDIDNFNMLDTTKTDTDYSQELCDNDSDLDLDRTTKDNRNINRYNDSTINRIQAMAISDDDEYGKWNFCLFVLIYKK